MSPALTAVSTIPSGTATANPLDLAIHNAGRKLLDLRLTRLSPTCRPDKSEAQSLVRDLLDVSRIVD